MPTDDNQQDDSLRATLDAAFAEKAASPSDDNQQTDTPVTPTPADKPDPAAPAGDKPAAPAADKPAPKAKVQAPARFTKEEKDEWDKLDEGVDEKTAAAIEKIKSILVNRNRGMEGEFTRQMQTIASDRQYKAGIDEILAPYREQWKAAGITDHAALKELVDGFEFSNKNPVGFIKWIAQQRNIDLQKFAHHVLGTQPGQPQTQQPGQQQPGMQIHPEVQRVLDEQTRTIANLQQQLGGQVQQVQQHLSRQQQAEQDSINAQAKNEVQRFEEAVDEAGNAKYPFARDVRPQMAILIKSGHADTLEAAYDQAVYANPTTRQRVLDDRDRSLRKAAEQRQREDAARARAAAGGLAGGGAPVTSAEPAAPAVRGSVRDLLDAEVSARMAASSRRI